MESVWGESDGGVALPGNGAFFSFFLQDESKKKEDYALCECKFTPFLVGIQYPNVGIFLDLYGVFLHL